jgi:ribonuclease HI
MTLQRLKSKSNANSMLLNDIHQNLIDLHQKHCQIHIHRILSHKNIIENEKADKLIKIATKESSTVSNMKITIINFVKKQICKKIELQ